MRIVAEEFLKVMPIAMPFIHEVGIGFVASGFIMAREQAQQIQECSQWCPRVGAGRIRPIFKWSPILSTWQDDLINGVPTEQNDIEWDKPYGIKCARQRNNIYAGIDRSFSPNSWWKIHESGWILAVKLGWYMLANVSPEDLEAPCS